MVFASYIFLFIAFPIFFIIYFALKRNIKAQNLWALCASLIIYSWGGICFTLLLVVSIIFNYAFTIKMDEAKTKGRKDATLALIVLVNVFLLLLFKYSFFAAESLQSFLKMFSVSICIDNVQKIPLPVGISFYTFQILSYVVDVYMGKVSAQKNFVNLALYISLFPQLVAGPIVRYVDIEKEINQRESDVTNIYVGIRRFSIGLSKKVILANTLGVIADGIFDHLGYGDWKLSWLGILCYSLQIYYDFSGYSDMAIGMGRMMGFHFLENFNYPYISLSVKEFWRRWHISLSSWFRDYVYIPLGGNRTGHTYRNLFIVFLITGLWHGASWTFVIWGIWHGIFIILERGKWGEILKIIPNIIKRCYTLMVVAVGWVFFRSETIENAIAFIKNMFSTNMIGSSHFQYYLSNWNIFIISIGLLCCCPIKNLIQKNKLLNNVLIKGVEDILIVICYLLTLVFISGTKFNPFIYFKF